jgi:hypothetical protein
MRQQGCGGAINLASVHAFRRMPDHTIYARRAACRP